MFEKYNNIVVVLGAGISVNAGIPDFRSEKGIYQNHHDNSGFCSNNSLASEPHENPKKLYNLSDDETIEDILTLEYFMTGLRLNNNYDQVAGFGPEALNNIIKDIIKKDPQPTFTHIFLSNLCKYNKIRKIYTQNIDGLEEKAGIPKDKLIYCHGNIKTCSCCECGKKYDIKKILDNFDKKEYTFCTENIKYEDSEKFKICEGIIKPDVILFGEKLKDEYFENIKEDLENCDLLLVIGTSLKVSPVNNIIKDVNKTTLVIYVNKEAPDFYFTEELHNFHFFKKDCDEFFRNTY